MDDEELGIFEFLAQSTQARIAHYRRRAAELRIKAETACSGCLTEAGESLYRTRNAYPP